MGTQLATAFYRSGRLPLPPFRPRDLAARRYRPDLEPARPRGGAAPRLRTADHRLCDLRMARADRPHDVAACRPRLSADHRSRRGPPPGAFACREPPPGAASD